MCVGSRPQAEGVGWRVCAPDARSRRGRGRAWSWKRICVDIVRGPRPAVGGRSSDRGPPATTGQTGLGCGAQGEKWGGECS